jgi:hypothetical protein
MIMAIFFSLNTLAYLFNKGPIWLQFCQLSLCLCHPSIALEACICKDGELLLHLLDLLLCFSQAEDQLWFFVGQEWIARLLQSLTTCFSSALVSFLLPNEMSTVGPKQRNSFLIAHRMRNEFDLSDMEEKRRETRV